MFNFERPVGTPNAFNMFIITLATNSSAKSSRRQHSVRCAASFSGETRMSRAPADEHIRVSCCREQGLRLQRLSMSTMRLCSSSGLLRALRLSVHGQAIRSGTTRHAGRGCLDRRACRRLRSAWTSRMRSNTSRSRCKAFSVITTEVSSSRAIRTNAPVGSSGARLGQRRLVRV
jgi:hypothetical protein